MLRVSDIAVDVFRYFSRTFLAGLQQLGRGLSDKINRLCPEYPLHQISHLKIEMASNGQCAISSDSRPFTDSNNLTLLAGQIDFLRHAYVDRCVIRSMFGGAIYAVTRVEWSRMTGSLRRAHVKEYDIYRLNLTSLNDTALGGLLDGPSVASLCLDQCVVRSLFVGDSFLAKCTEKRVTSLSINENELVDGRPFQPRASVEALLDFCTRTANAGNAEASFQLSLLLTDNLFLHRFLKQVEKLRFQSPIRCRFDGITKQKRLDSFSKYRSETHAHKYLFKLPTPPSFTHFHVVEYFPYL